MCFAVPAKVISTDKNNAIIEGGIKIRLGSEIRVERGDYLQIAGNVAVGKLSKSEGMKIRRLIKSLSSPI